jgi:hypothetical protein
MSRSRKKTPVIGTTMSETEKEFKQQEHQRERSAVRDALRSEKEVLPHPKEYGNPWAGPKDGKRYLGNTKYEERIKRK